MGWEVTIQRADGAPLGEVPEVCETIARAVPDIQFFRDPGGRERVEAARALGKELPESLRRHLLQIPARVRAEFEGGGHSVQLYGFEAEPLRALRAEVRGDGDPTPFLADLCRPEGWIVLDDTTGQAVDLSSAAAGWEAFRAYRDRVRRDPAE